MLDTLGQISSGVAQLWQNTSTPGLLGMAAAVSAGVWYAKPAGTAVAGAYNAKVGVNITQANTYKAALHLFGKLALACAAGAAIGYIPMKAINWVVLPESSTYLNTLAAVLGGAVAARAAHAEKMHFKAK